MNNTLTDLLVVIIRDIARAERMGHCTAKYLADAAELLRAAETPLTEVRTQPTLQE